MPLDDNDQLHFKQQLSSIADKCFGNANNSSIIERNEKLLANGTYSYIVRQLIIAESFVLDTSTQGFLFLPESGPIDNNPEEDELPERIWNGNGLLFQVNEQSLRVMAIHSQGYISLNCISEESYSLVEITDQNMGDEDNSNAVLTDLIYLQDLRNTLLG